MLTAFQPTLPPPVPPTVPTRLGVYRAGALQPFGFGVYRVGVGFQVGDDLHACLTAGADVVRHNP